MNILNKPAHRPLFFSLLIIALLLAGLITAIQLSERNQDTRTQADIDQIDLTLVPESLTANTDKTVDLDIFVHQNNLRFAAATVHITFDPNLLQLDQIQPSSGVMILDQATESGQLTVSFGIECYPDNTCFNIVDSAYRLSTLNFTTKTPGTTTVSLTPETQATAVEMLPVNRTGTLSDSHITITSPPSPSLPTSPSPTISYNPSPLPATPTVSPPPLPTSDNSTVYGIVLNKLDQTAISGTTVNLRIPGVNGKPGIIQTTLSSSAGYYQFTAPVSAYDVEFIAKGFIPKTASLTLKADALFRKDVELEPKNPNKFLDIFK